jgi:Ni,Fe-hydrogenase III component G
MPKLKREHARLERELIEVLTQACEVAKSEITGFCWLTHEIDYERFPESVQVIWVFDTQLDREQAAALGLNARMVELTAVALHALEINLNPLADHVHFDSEEECHRSHGGDWQRRLSRLSPKRRS